MDKLIKRVLSEEIENDSEHLIAHRDRMYVRIEMVLPKLVHFLEQYLKEYNLYSIDVTDGRSSYATWVKNQITGKSELYSGDIKILTLRFVNLMNYQRTEIKRDVISKIEDVFAIPVREYMIPLDVKFINLVDSEF